MKAEDVLRPDAPKKRILVIGDGMTDIYIHGCLEGCQDGCQKFVAEEHVEVPGGACSARRSLDHVTEAFCEYDPTASCIKTRLLVDGRIVFRTDNDRVSNKPFGIHNMTGFDGVYVADYAKGFLTDDFIRQIVRACVERGIPCVVDPKRDPECAKGAVLKCNGDFAAKHVHDRDQQIVVTESHRPPLVLCDSLRGRLEGFAPRPPHCVNHVGAGDCFGAWLTLGLAHGLELPEAARLAHAAGRVYVQHPHNRPPYPHEVRKELDPVGGKVLASDALASLRSATAGRVVWTNGVYKLPHAGHSWLFRWAKSQGDVLVVGVNDDVSAFRQKHGFCLPLTERIQLIAAQEAVDWVVPFSADTPIAEVTALKPDCMARGADQYNDGSELCEVRVAPESPFNSHASDILKRIRG